MIKLPLLADTKREFYDLEGEMNYLWDDEIPRRQYPALKGDRKTDVLIIGGGMAGVLCAYRLKELGVDCLLAEGGADWKRHHTGNHRGLVCSA